ncbi:MAG: putative nucleic acid-binding protein [Verrucomicrobiales bacterium]|jgi:predicted nucleic acid-binding protein
MMVLVDSSTWIGALRRDGDTRIKLAIQGLLDEYEALLCSPVKLEVLGGTRKEERPSLQKYFAILPHAKVDEELWQKAIENACLAPARQRDYSALE